MKKLILGACVAMGLATAGCQRPATDVEVHDDGQQEGTGGGGWSEEGTQASDGPPVLDLNNPNAGDDEGTNYDLGSGPTGAGDHRPPGDVQVNQPYERETQPD